MNCEYVHENVALYVYEELADDVRFEMEQHMERCAGCKRELDLSREFRSTMNELPALEPSPNLLAASRMRFAEALEVAEQSRWQRWIFDPLEWLRQLKFSPALAAAILIVGFAAGIGAAFSTRPPSISIPQAVAPDTSQAAVAGIRGITRDANTNNIHIKYDTVLPESAQGSLDDPKIEQLLLYAARNQQNPGVRVESIDLLAQQCPHGNERVRQMLIYSLLYDKNPGVRLKAMDGLQSLVKTDTQVRDAVIEALLNDTNSGMRTKAIQVLQGVKADGSVRSAFERLAHSDQNSYIRKESERTLASLPDID